MNFTNSFKYRHESNTNIRDLPGKLMIDIRKRLDTGPHDSNWRAFIALLPKKYMYKQHEVERIGMEIYSGNSPTDQLILELGGRGFSVKELALILHQLYLEKPLLELVEYIPIKIHSQPKRSLEITEGEMIVLHVKATGLPYPRYQWFNGDSEVMGAVDPTLKIPCARVPDEGIYCCRIHNSKDARNVVFTDDCVVKIIPLPVTDLKSVPSHFPVINRHPLSKSVYLGDTFLLECEASGDPPLLYQWFHNNGFYTETPNTSIQVDNTTDYLSGLYHCVVKNSYGTSKSKIARIVVESGGNYPSIARRPEIVKHPSSLCVEIGGVAIFCCEATGSQPLCYQWTKNGEPLQDSNKSEYKLRDINQDNLGVYQCLVSNSIGFKLSQGAVLQVTDSIQAPLPVYTAVDKVALLIGNYDYRCEDALKAPMTDIQNLSEIFTSLSFKVVPLLNLTLPEMKNAVEHFCALLGSGVYGVFYFCGHGFEEKKEIYLVPQDAPTGYLTKDCLPSEYVLSRMQRQQPQVSCLILDVCRTPNKVTSPDVLTNMEEKEVVTAANTIFLYATSEGNQAYENSNHGLLVKSLQQYLPTRLSIEGVIAKVREEFGKRILPNNKIQNPEMKSNLNQPGRSFADKIEYTGHTQSFTLRQQAWENCLKTSPDIILNALPKELGIVLELTFQRDFANVLTIFVKVANPGKTKKCLAWIGRHPNTISTMKGTPTKLSDDDKYSKTKNTLQDIQKLKENLEVTIYIKYSLEDEENLLSSQTVIGLGLPLVASLYLWRESHYPMSYRREATEQDDQST